MRQFRPKNNWLAKQKAEQRSGKGSLAEFQRKLKAARKKEAAEKKEETLRAVAWRVVRQWERDCEDLSDSPDKLIAAIDKLKEVLLKMEGGKR